MGVSDYVSLALVVVAIPTLFVAWRQWREVVRRRHVDMYWRIFDAYNSEELRRSRDAFFKIEKQLQLSPSSGLTERIPDPARLRDYSTQYWRDFYEGDPYHQRLDRLARARVRFYAQTGVLLKKRLVDQDLLFGLIGPPLDVDMRLLDVVIDANREGHHFPRMFEEVEYAYREYQRWQRRPERVEMRLTRHM
jgi:hypothetical protein